MSLFRREALEAQADHALGNVNVALPVRSIIYAYFLVFVVVVSSGYAFWGGYSRRVTVQGYVQPAGDVIRLYPPQSGVLLKRYIQEGQTVSRNATLFILTSEKQSSSGPTQGQIVASIQDRLYSYQQSMDEQRTLGHMQKLDLSQRLATTEREIAQAQNEQAILQQRLLLAQKTLQRFEALANSGFVSLIQLQQKDEERLDIERSLASVGRALTALVLDKESLSAELHTLPLKQKAQEAELHRNATALKQDLAESEVMRELRITAPEDGLITSVTAQPGTSVGPQQPLAMLVPKRTEMEVHLYAPSKAIGFVQPGAKVKLRYEAFPYQKFGHADGTVKSVSRTALLPNEIPGMETKEPLYRIRVKLAKPYVLAYGKAVPLVPSMRVEGDIMLETRKLYEWALEPLYSVTGKW